MEKQRKIKILSIVALVVAIVGMSLGFAAFSSSLNISSDASVSPNGDDFKVRIVSSDGTNVIKPVSVVGDSTASDAIIGSDGLSLNDINVSLPAPGSAAVYRFYIQNDSPYDAYFASFERMQNKSCVAIDDNMNQELLSAACDSVVSGFDIYDVDGTKILSDLIGRVLHPGERHMIDFKIVYMVDGTLADGQFMINFPNIVIKYSTTY